MYFCSQNNYFLHNIKLGHLVCFINILVISVSISGCCPKLSFTPIFEPFSSSSYTEEIFSPFVSSLLLLVCCLIGPSGCVRCHGNKVSTINGVIFLSSLSLRRVTFLPEGVIVGFRNFAWGFNSQKK